MRELTAIDYAYAWIPKSVDGQSPTFPTCTELKNYDNVVLVGMYYEEEAAKAYCLLLILSKSVLSLKQYKRNCGKNSTK